MLNTASRNHIAAAVWDRAESAVDAGIGQHIKDKLDAIIADTEDIQDWESSYVEISDTEIIFKRTDGTVLATFNPIDGTVTTTYEAGYEPA